MRIPKLLVVAALFAAVSGCGVRGAQWAPVTGTTEEPNAVDAPNGMGAQWAPLTPEEPVRADFYSAKEAGIFYGDIAVQADGGAGRFEQKNADDKLEFVVSVTEGGFYRFEFEVLTITGRKENNLVLDGAPYGSFSADSSDYEISSVSRVYLESGEHTIAVTANWGWIQIKSLTVVAEGEVETDYAVSARLVNADASEGALRLMSFLADNYGKTSLAGAQSQGDWKRDNGLFGGESEFIFRKTGKRPAVIGLDMIDYTPSRVEKGSVSFEVEAAIEAWENNAIVTFCWHWNAPAPYITGNYGGGFYTENTENGFFKKIMDGADDAGYQLILRDIDAIAEQLKRLRDAGVPILWRPLHEAAGGWFWWGTDRESYLKLYKLMYIRLTRYHGLDNLIWVWNGQNKDWYPGDEFADIIGEDVYPGERDHSSQVNKFTEAYGYAGAGKMVVLSENGRLFEPSAAKRDGALWGYWCVWNGEFTTTEKYNTFDILEKVYNSEFVTTWADLPDLKTYPIRED